jgi:spore coat-associated protein N
MNIGLSTLAGKMIASVAVLGSAATVAGLGTFGSFTSTTSSNNTIATTAGTVAISLAASGTANRLSVAATGLVPGDTVQRAVDLNNTGNQNLASIALTTSASPTSLLDSSSAMGLKVQVDSCATAWVETGVSPAYTYTCGGAVTPVVAILPVATAAVTPATLTGLNTLTAGTTDHLKVTLSLPTSADNTLQGLTSTLNLAFTGTQRVATNR